MGTIETFFENLEQKVAGFFGAIPQKSQDVLTASNKFINVVKSLVNSTPAQTVIDLGEAFFPAATGVVTGAEAILNDLTGITSETPGQVLLQATQKAASLVGTAKVAAFSNIATAVASAANKATNGTLTDQQITSLNQLIHDGTVLDAPAQSASVNQSTLPQGDTAFVPTGTDVSQLTPEQQAALNGEQTTVSNG